MTLLDSLGDREDSAVSKESFVKGLIYSWMVLNTDAHAKNYSLQLYPRRAVLAPLYDVSSLIPYVNSIGAKESELLETFGRTKLSMRIAASYESASMGGLEWRGVARDAGLNANAATEWATTVASLLPQVIAAAAAALPTHLQTNTIGRYVDRIGARARQVQEALAV